jgi:hypothetical protein
LGSRDRRRTPYRNVATWARQRISPSESGSKAITTSLSPMPVATWSIHWR